MMKLQLSSQLRENISLSVQTAINEDVATGDVTASLISDETQAVARLICRDKAVICGVAWVQEVFQQIDSQVSLDWCVADGDSVAANTHLCTFVGRAKSILTAERVALNFLQTLSATATQTQSYVEAIAASNAKILDTRKTLPNLRLAQKYAVLCGGGKNHRIGLYDMILIKENHIMAAGSISAAISTARDYYPNLKVEVETETLAEFYQAVAADSDIIMLDNFSIADMTTAVAYPHGKILLEASGGVELEKITKIAATGVDYISVGDITKNIYAIDLSLRFL
jgi:nicotinate-nucleotide pyrophosphorylase (carboxylating)